MNAPAPKMKVLEVAALFGVDRRTVTTWANQGKLTTTRTLGGHRRFDAAEVDRLYAELRKERQP